MRVVLDTNVLVRANVRADGPAHKLLDRLQGGAHVLLVSDFILEEVGRVLRYPRLQSRWGMSDDEIREFVADLRDNGEWVTLENDESIGPTLSDPDDHWIVRTAVKGRADVLCTLDRHLRTLEVRGYCESRGITILTDVELLDRLRAK